MKGRIGLWFAVLGMAAGIAVGQTPVGQGGGGGAAGGVIGGPVTAPGVLGGIVTAGPVGGTFQSASGTGTFTMPATMFGGSAVSGAPYSGEQVYHTVQTLVDGTHITRTSSQQKTWRDSHGRTRTERQMGGMSSRPNAPKAPVIIEIRDPVAGVGYILDIQAKVAHRITLQQPPGMTAVRPINPVMAQGSRIVTSSSVTGDGVENRAESLGNQSIEGVMALGTRTTTTYPVNYDGNDRPIVTTQETWMSPELGIMLLSKRYDPRNGETTQKIANLSRAEPDIALFQPPPDYTVVDETGPTVTIRYSAQ